MQSFTRGNLIDIAASFSSDGSNAAPSVAEVEFGFVANGSPKREILPLTFDVNAATWRGRWDSSECDGGTVDYVVRCRGDLVAATQGVFRLWSNDANTN